MKSLPKLSIICPVYNAEKYLVRILESLLNQDYRDFELIMVNDGSSDDSKKIIEKYSKKDKRVKMISQKNQGIAKARNKGMTEAEGEYLMFVDNDDYVNDGYLKNYVEEIESGDGYDIVMGGYRRINGKGVTINSQSLNPRSEWSKYIIMAPWAKIYRREFLINNKIEFLDYIGEDLYFNLSCLNNHPKVKIIKNDGYVWFYNEKSFSNTNKSRGAKNDIDVVKLFDYLEKVTDYDDEYVKYFLKRYVTWYLIFLGENSTKKELKKQYQILNTYLRKKRILKVINPMSTKLKGERFKNRMAVLGLIVSEKLHVVDLFLGIIARQK